MLMKLNCNDRLTKINTKFRLFANVNPITLLNVKYRNSIIIKKIESETLIKEN